MLTLYGELDFRQRDELADLSFEDIDGCHDGAQLREWYDGCREFADNVIAQIEANSETHYHGDDWHRRANNLVAALKRKMRRILRHCAANSIERPDNSDARQRDEIRRLNNQLSSARSTERQRVVSFLRHAASGTPEALANAIEAKEHIAFSRSNFAKGLDE